MKIAKKNLFGGILTLFHSMPKILELLHQGSAKLARLPRKCAILAPIQFNQQDCIIDFFVICLT